MVDLIFKPVPIHATNIESGKELILLRHKYGYSIVDELEFERSYHHLGVLELKTRIIILDCNLN